MNHIIFSEISHSKRKKFRSTEVKNSSKTIRDMTCKHSKYDFLEHLNLNSPRRNSESVNKLIKDTSDIFLVSES